MSRTTIDIHVLQTVPPSNVNRDDTGSPKTAVYGGVRRARVSSQAWKRATRRAFEDELDASDLGVRTKRVVELVAARITERAGDLEGDAVTMATGVLKSAGVDLKPPRRSKGEDVVPDQSGYLLFLSRHQVDRLAGLAIDAARSGLAAEKVDRKEAKAAADTAHSVDVALFGRMVADSTDLNVDAACQVAHALGVHATETEYDYFTAVDDRAQEDEPGAGMIGTVEFTSSTLYRYATVDVDRLQDTLGDAAMTERAVAAFVRSFVTSMPTGKQNTFAHRTLPDAVVVTVRDGQPVNLVGAFEEAVVAPEGSTRLREACSRLADYSTDVDRAYGRSARAAFVLRVGSATAPLAELGDEVDLEGLVSGVGRAAFDDVPVSA